MKKQTPQTPWLTSAEAAEYARCSRNTISLAASKGELVGHQTKPHSPWRFLQDDLDRWIGGTSK